MTILIAVVLLAAANCAIGFRRLTPIRTQGITSIARTTGYSIITRNVESSNKLRSTSLRIISNSDAFALSGSFEALQLAFEAQKLSPLDSKAVPMLEKAVELETSSKLLQARYRSMLAHFYRNQCRLVEAAEQCEIVSSSYPIAILKNKERMEQKREE